MSASLTTTPQTKPRVLIVGAGIAGLSLAGLLKKYGFQPVIVEREPKETYNTSGYMIGLMPLGGRVLNMLDLHDAYLQNSLSIKDYSLHDMSGPRLNHFGMDAISKYGNYQSISRPMLANLLLSVCDEPRFGTHVTAITQRDNQADVTFSDGNTETFDTVVIADGIHSATRDLAFAESNRAYRQTGWAGWAWFAKTPPELATSYREYWGANRFMGLYPVENDQLGIFLGGNAKDIKKAGHTAVVENLKRQIGTSDLNFDKLLQPLSDNPDLFFWDFHDCRTKTWVNGNVVLLGDAAAGFLPTAGVGASMAMDSASILAEELARADPDQINYALRLYEKRQKDRVESAQSTSRTLGNLMFVKNPVFSKLRNQSMRFMSVNSFLSSIKKLIEER